MGEILRTPDDYSPGGAVFQRMKARRRESHAPETRTVVVFDIQKDCIMAINILHDWLPIEGEWVEIRKEGRLVCAGIVDAVAADGSVLWLGQDRPNRPPR